MVAVAAVLALAPPAAAQSSGETPAATQRVTAERLARAGLTRTDDLFWFLNGWATSSLDGYAGRPSAAGMPGTPLLVAGGQPLTGGPFGQPPLPVLPVHLQQVKAVDASRAPRLADGRLAPDGAVRLRLRPPGTGLEAQGAFSAGNEVGDPGPFRTTEREVLNEDRIGPQYFGEASLRGADASAQVSLRSVRHYTTDRAIRARAENVQDTLDGPPLQQLVAPRLVLSAEELLPGTHRLTAHYAALRSLPFFKTLGYELPARRRHAHIGVRGAPSGNRSDRTQRLRYRFGYRRATLASDAGRFRSAPPPNLTFDWTEDHLTTHVGVGDLSLPFSPLPGNAPVRLRFGVSADYTRAQAKRASLDDPTLLTTRAYAELAAPSAAFRPRLAALLSQTDGQLGGGALLSSQFPLGRRSSLGLHLGYVRAPYAAGGPFWYWLQQGLPAPQHPEGQVALPSSPFPASERLTADLRLRRTFAGGLRLALELSARHFQHLSLPSGSYRFARIALPAYAPPGGALVPHLRLHTEASGQTVRAAIEGTHTAPAGLTHQLRYNVFAHHATGEGGARRAFDQRFARVPRHQLRYTARLAVATRFSLEGRVTARSPEHWPAYRPAEADDSSYPPRLPAFLRVDLTATKRLWRDHLRLRLALRNLLDAPLRRHPAGPVRRLTLFLSFEAQL
ncbi:MAG: hypothetical protein BRD37_01945 [Bacteroidetes bacterium QH_8_67_23]|nr:MAG: hypothetical protein BRD37_01945 [Bacteroidetes bacterium QH_8_67_23]